MQQGKAREGMGVSRRRGWQGLPRAGVGTACSVWGMLHLLATLRKPEAPPDSCLTKPHLLETSGRGRMYRPRPTLVLESTSCGGSPEARREGCGGGGPTGWGLKPQDPRWTVYLGVRAGGVPQLKS